MNVVENNPEINFPALSFNDGWLGTVQSLDSLTRPSRLAVRNGFYKHLVMVDSNLNKFQIISFKKVRTLFSFSFGAILELIAGNPKWLVDVTLGPPSKSSIEEVKRLIADCFERHKDFWEEMLDFEEFQQKIAGANSIERVFTVFREFHQL